MDERGEDHDAPGHDPGEDGRDARRERAPERAPAGDEERLRRETIGGFILLVLLIVVFVVGMWVLSSIIYGQDSPRAPAGSAEAVVVVAQGPER